MGDKRRTARLVDVAARMTQNSGDSFSSICEGEDALLEGTYNQMPDAELFKTLPGTGSCLAPRLLVAMGENRDRFETAADLQKLAGIAPVTERNAKKCW